MTAEFLRRVGGVNYNSSCDTSYRTHRGGHRGERGGGVVPFLKHKTSRDGLIPLVGYGRGHVPLVEEEQSRVEWEQKYFCKISENVLFRQTEIWPVRHIFFFKPKTNIRENTNSKYVRVQA